MNVRVDFVDPSPEGAALLGALKDARFDVLERAMDTVERSTADLLVLAADSAGALEALRKLRDDGLSPDIVVVLLGTPDGMTHRGGGEPGLGAEAVLLRPIEPPSLVEVVQRLSCRAAPSTRRLSEDPLRAADTSENPTAITARERTVQLVGEERPKEGVQKTPQIHPESMTPSSSGVVRGPVAVVSERLRDLLFSADRRAFPTRAAIDLSLPGGDESAALLVPRELFDHHEVLADVLAIEDDPLDALTFVSGPALLEESLEASGEEATPTPRTAPKSSPPTAPNRPSRLAARRAEEVPEAAPMRLPTELEHATSGHEWDVASAPPSTGVHEAVLRPEPSGSSHERSEHDWPTHDSVLGPLGACREYRGVLGEGGLLRVLFRATELSGEAQLTLFAPGNEARLWLRGTELVRIEGDVSRRAAESLRSRGVSLSPADDEETAHRVLERAAARGALSRLELERALREAREALLVHLLQIADLSFTLSRSDARGEGQLGALPLGMPFRAALAEVSRRAMSRTQWLRGIGAQRGVSRTARFTEIAAEGWIRPEMASLIAAHEGAPVDLLLDEAASEPGVPGLLAALLAAGALTLESAAALRAAPGRGIHARRMIEEARKRVEDADYFGILAVSMDATPAELSAAYRARTDELASVDLEELGLTALGAARREVLHALSEAHRVLRNSRWRDAYAKALRA